MIKTGEFCGFEIFTLNNKYKAGYDTPDGMFFSTDFNSIDELKAYLKSII